MVQHRSRHGVTLEWRSPYRSYGDWFLVMTKPSSLTEAAVVFRGRTKVELLQISQLKWEMIVAFIKEKAEIPENGGMATCALCQRYFEWKYSEDNDCELCPVMEKYGFEMCAETPYEHWITAWKEKSVEKALQAAEDCLAALKELEEEARNGR